MDHCAANAFLDAFAEAQAQRGEQYTLSINWDAWLGVGQAAKASLSKRLQEILHTGVPAESTGTLWDQLLVDEPDREVHAIELSTARQWFLDEHRLQGDGVLPGTGYLALLRSAVARHAADKTITMRKVSFLAPLIVKDDEVREARLILERRDDAFDFRIVSKAGARVNGDGEWKEHVKGKISWNENNTVKHHSLTELLQRLVPQPFNRDETLKGETLSKDFGPRWQNLVQSLSFVDGEGLACLELPSEFAGDLKLFELHPSLMDAATGFGQLVGSGAYLPQAYDSITINGALPQKIYSYAKFKRNSAKSGEALVYDLIVMDDEGRELVEIQDYTLRQITDLRAFRSTAKAVADLDELSKSRTVATDAGQVGLLPAEGAEAFDLVLRSGIRVPRIAISTRSLPTLIEHGAAPVTAAPILDEVNKFQSQRKKHSRPNLQVPYVPPRNEVETKLTHMWQDALNIEDAGIHDNFFDMGGDSLIATLLVDRLTEAFQVNVSLAALINAPTVAEMSEIIAELREQEAAPKTSEAAV